jgi:predicted transcriptional regulator
MKKEKKKEAKKEKSIKGLLSFITKYQEKNEMHITLQIRAGFMAYHFWKNAPKEVSFLRNPHRHIFSVTAMLPVTDENRELEFFIVQRDLIKYLRSNYEGKTFGKSCEIFAKEIKKYLDTKYLRSCSVGVYEDGENGAIVQ